MPLLPKFFCIKDKNKASGSRSYILEQTDDILHSLCQMNPSESLWTLNCNLIWVDPRRVTENTDGASLVLPAGEFWSQTEASPSYCKTIKANEPAGFPRMMCTVFRTRPSFHCKSQGWVWAFRVDTNSIWTKKGWQIRHKNNTPG